MKQIFKIGETMMPSSMGVKTDAIIDPKPVAPISKLKSFPVIRNSMQSVNTISSVSATPCVIHNKTDKSVLKTIITLVFVTITSVAIIKVIRMIWSDSKKPKNED